MSTTPEAVSQLALASLRESPTNPRKTFNDPGLAELAESIKSQGVLQPIVVRPVVDNDIRHTHEVVFGHRRYRATELAGLATIPAIVRAMTDAQAAQAQLHENLEREDVPPIEEAEAFRALMREHDVTVAQLIQQTGKSRSYIYGRLKLASVHADVRQAVATGLIDAEVATLIARVPNPLQPKALARCVFTDYSVQPPTPTSRSYRQCKEALREDFTELLGEVIFAQDDAQLDPLAGPCTTCPHRSDNEPDLLAELGAGVCTNPPCLAYKTEAHRAALLAAAQADNRVYGEAHAKGVTLLRDWAINGPGPAGNGHLVIRLEQALARLQAAGQDAPLTCYLVRGNAHHECLRNDQAEDVVARVRKLLGLPDGLAPLTTGSSTPPQGEGDADDDDDMDDGAGGRDEQPALTLAEQVATDSAAWLQVRKAVMAAVLRSPRTADELRLVLHHEYNFADGFGLVDDAVGITTMLEQEQGNDDDVSPGEVYRRWIDNASPDALAAALVALAVDDLLGSAPRFGRVHSDVLAPRIALAQRYGVDVVATGRGDANPVGPAGGDATAERCPNTADLFERAA